MRRQSLYFTSPMKVEIIEETLPSVGPGEVLVRTIVSAISAGTELLFLRGEVPPGIAVDESIASLRGEANRFPMKYGYAVVGRVEEVGRDVESTLEDRLVFAFHPHESRFVTTPDALIDIGSEMAPEKAVLLPTMETALSLVMDAQPVVGERVVVIGLGMVGLLATYVFGSMSLGRLVGVDTVPLRREHAVRLGADDVVEGDTADVIDAIHATVMKSAGGEEYHGADLAMELTGQPAGLDTAIQSVGFNGRVIIGSWYGTKAAALRSLGAAFHRQHVELRSSQVSRLNPRWTGRWTKERRLQTALRILASLPHDPLITHRHSFERAPDAYQTLENNPQDALQVLLTYEEP
jgi:2-desacetyl-2-hydroxyethyl bacteriochlorophyllide A dehydrogenase